MTNIFISYSRKDIDSARKIVEALAENDLDTWIDWHSIPKGEDWELEIYRGIEAAETFLFLMSPDSVQSEMCNKEIVHAKENNKRLIPVVIRDSSAVQFRLEASRDEIKRRNWIFCRDQSNEFATAIQEIIGTIRTDYEWLKYHTRLQVRTLEWERKNHEKSLLLRGKELEDAELQLSTTQEPYPTNLQREFVLRSRQATDQQRRNTLSIAVAGVIALALLAAFGFVQAGLARERASVALTAQANAVNESNQRATAQAIAESNQELAEERARIARAKELAAQSITLQDGNFQNSLLLGIEAFYLLDDAQTRGAMLDNLRANPQLQRIIAGHSGPISSVAFSPDGKILASASDDHTIILWDLTSDSPVGQPLNGHSGGIRSLAFSPDGKTLVSGGGEGTLIFWNIETRQPIGQPLTGHSSWISRVAYSADGKFIASAGFDGKIIIWDTVTRQPIGQPLSDESELLYSLAISPDGKSLVSTGYNTQSIISFPVLPPFATFWNLTTREYARRPFLQLQKTPENPFGFNEYGFVRDVVFSPDGRILASGTSDGVIILWDVVMRQMIGQPLIGHTANVNLEFSPDGTVLSSASSDGTLILWSVATGQPLGKPFTGHAGPVNDVSFSPDGRLLASGGQDGLIIMWDISNAASKNVTTSYPVGEPVTGTLGSQFSMAFSPDGKTMVSGNIFAISFWDMTSWPPDRQSNVDNVGVGQVHSVAFSTDGKIIASGDDSKVTLWDPLTRAAIKEPLGYHSDTVNSVAFSPDSRILASASKDGTISLWDATAHKSIGEPIIGHAGSINSLAFSPDGMSLASACEDNSIIVWDITNPENPQVTTIYSAGESIPGHSGPVNSVAFSHDGKILASGSDDMSIILWDVATARPIGPPLTGHLSTVSGVAFSPDDRLLASIGFDEMLILWDIKTGRPIGQPLRGSPAILYGLAFSPDGKTIATGGGSTTFILWDIDPLSWIEKTCERAGRNFTQTEWREYFPGEAYHATCPNLPAGE